MHPLFGHLSQTEVAVSRVWGWGVGLEIRVYMAVS